MKNFLFSNLNRRSGPARAKRAGLGQSLVEMALTLPILMTIIAGTVEVTNLLTVYNQVQLSAREAARLAAQGGPDSSLMGVIQNTSTGSAIVTPSLMRVWVVRPVIQCNADPDDIATPCTGATSWVYDNATMALPWGVAENCIYPVPCTPATPTNPITPASVLAQLNIATMAPNATNGTGLNKSTMSVVVIRYEATTLLNLRWFGSDTGRFPLYAYSVTRQEVSTQNANQLSSGCSAYPIALSSNILSNPSEGTIVSAPMNTYNVSGQDGFGLVAWNTGTTTVNDVYNSAPNPDTGSMVPPGNTLTLYQEPGSNPLDTTLHRGDTVAMANITAGNFTGTVVPYLQQQFDNIAPQERAIRVIVYTPAANNPGIIYTPPLPGTPVYGYTVANFAIVRIVANAGLPLFFEFIRWDSSCGFTF